MDKEGTLTTSVVVPVTGTASRVFKVQIRRFKNPRLEKAK